MSILQKHPTIFQKNYPTNVTRQQNFLKILDLLSISSSTRPSQTFWRLEVESGGSMPFLDILIKNKTNSSFNTSVFPKNTFPGFTLKQLLTPRKYTINLINSIILGRCWKFWDLEICLIFESVFTLYPRGIIYYNIQNFVNNRLLKKKQFKVPRKFA